jgi:prephenate dehydrogenase
MASAEHSPFPRVAVVGFGLIGGSIGLAIKRRWPKSRVVAIDETSVIDTAVRSGAADTGGNGVALCKDAALVVLAAPVLQNIEIVQRLGEFVPSDCLVTDVGSTKRAMVAAAARVPDIKFVGGHPMAGASRGGLAAARPDLFDGHAWILTPDARHVDQLEPLERFVHGLGGVPHIMSAELHDRLVGAVSHLPQLTATALMHVVGRLAGDAGFELAGPGLADTTRLAESPADIWRDITATNEETLRDALDAMIATLTELRNDLADRGKVDAIFASAAQWRHALRRARGDA